MSHFTVSQKLTQCKFRKKNIASVNIGRGIYVFELVFLFYLDIYPGEELLDCMVVLFLIF